MAKLTQNQLALFTAQQEMIENHTKVILSLREERDGLRMQIDGRMAKINGQAKNIELLKKQGYVAQCKVEAWKEIALELIEEQKESPKNVCADESKALS